MRKREIWKSIPDWPTYRVSNHGRIKRLNIPRVNGWALREHFLSTKSRHTMLYDGARKKGIMIGALILTIFKGPPPDKKHSLARHLDDDFQNNYIDNLEWGSQKQNMADAKRNGIRIGGVKGRIVSLKTRRLMSKLQKGRPHGPMTQKHKEAISQSWARKRALLGPSCGQTGRPKGIPCSTAQKRRLKKLFTGRPWSAARRAAYERSKQPTLLRPSRTR